MFETRGGCEGDRFEIKTWPVQFVRSDETVESGVYLEPRGSSHSWHIQEQYDESYNLTDNSSEDGKERQRLKMGE